MDASCGSGLFTRRFAAAGTYSAVVAADFSEAMLRQTRTYLEAQRPAAPTPVSLVRCDIGRLPFAAASFDAARRPPGPTGFCFALP